MAFSITAVSTGSQRRWLLMSKPLLGTSVIQTSLYQPVLLLFNRASRPTDSIIRLLCCWKKKQAWLIRWSTRWSLNGRARTRNWCFKDRWAWSKEISPSLWRRWSKRASEKTSVGKKCLRNSWTGNLWKRHCQLNTSMIKRLVSSRQSISAARKKSRAEYKRCLENERTGLRSSMYNPSQKTRQKSSLRKGSPQRTSSHQRSRVHSIKRT